MCFYRSAIQKIYLPKTIDFIANNAFGAIGGTLHIYYEGTEGDWNNIKKYSEAFKNTKYELHYNSRPGDV